ncbi:MAG: hypothetical protein Q7S22_07245 [Candidatus Micrarchaeota archaeon]|nr:hypothetical protein [Candidatus Micrarchaeota archaeon]
MITPTLKQPERLLPRLPIDTTNGTLARKDNGILTEEIVPWSLVRTVTVDTPKKKRIALPRILAVDPTRPPYGGNRLHNNSVLVSSKPRRSSVYFVSPAPSADATGMGKQYSNYRINWVKHDWLNRFRNNFIICTFVSLETARNKKLMTRRFGSDAARTIWEVTRVAKKEGFAGIEVEEFPTLKEVERFKLALAREAGKTHELGKIMRSFLRRNPELKISNSA